MDALANRTRRGNMDVIIVQAWMLCQFARWQHGRHHRAGMDALATLAIRTRW